MPWSREMSGAVASKLPKCNFLEKMEFIHEKTGNKPTQPNVNYDLVSINYQFGITNFYQWLQIWHQKCERASHNPCLKKIKDRYTYGWSKEILELDDKKSME